MKEFIINNFPFLLDLRRKKELHYDKNEKIHKCLMLHNIPKKRSYFFYSTLNDWINNIKVIKNNFNINFIPNNLDEISITIDDGFRNIKPFLDYLIKDNIPVTIFVSTLGFENKIYPYSVIIQLFRRFKSAYFNIDGYVVKFNSKNKLWREREAFKFNRYLLKNLSYQQYIDLSKRILKEYSDLFLTIDEDLQLFDRNEIEYYSQFSNISIQSHGINHFNMKKLTENELDRELSFSKKEIEKVTKREVKYFAYPYGFYNERVIKLTKLYYKKAFIVGEDNDNFHINRIGLDNKKIKVKN